MTFVIGLGCIDVKDRRCVSVCPVDSIYEGDRKLYIQPDECIDCGACEAACPEQAIFIEDDPIEGEEWTITDNAEFFSRPLPGRDEPLGSPGGAATTGVLGVDTPAVAGWPGPA